MSAGRETCALAPRARVPRARRSALTTGGMKRAAGSASPDDLRRRQRDRAVPPRATRSSKPARDGLAMLHAGGSGEPEDVYAIGDLDADGVPVRVYRPSAERRPAGRRLLPRRRMDDRQRRRLRHASTRALANAARRDRRVGRLPARARAPVPAPLDDCWTAFEWVAKNTAVFEGDPSRIAVGGDSAGGNLAAVVRAAGPRRGPAARVPGARLSGDRRDHRARRRTATTARATCSKPSRCGGSSTATRAAAPTSPTGTSRRCARRMSRASRPRSSSPPSTTRCATRARRTPSASPTRACPSS